MSPGPGFTKTLRFTYEDLGREGYLIFTFNNEKVSGQVIYEDYFPAVWRAVDLRESGRHYFYVIFRQRFLFATCQTQEGIVTRGSAVSKLIKFKESTELTVDDNGFKWSDPKQIAAHENVLQAHNQTAKAQAISFCSEGASPSDWPVALLCFKHVGAQTSIPVEFTGQLRIYNDPSFQHEISVEHDTICPKRAELVELPPSLPIWDHALDEEGLAGDWIITYNVITGNFETKAAE